VHDPTAYDLGGVSGNAGIFSTVEDLMKFMLFMLNESPVKLVSEATLHYWT
jgi:CubicO group peptidase (beta-lactamase class C family)